MMKDSEKRDYFVERYILHEHACRRSWLKKKAQIRMGQQEGSERVSEREASKQMDEREGSDRERSYCAPDDVDEYSSLHQFFSHSDPPMTRWLQTFIDYGCNKECHLRTIASWSLELIRAQLDQIPAGPDGRKLTGAEKFILQHHFKDYFGQPSNY